MAPFKADLADHDTHGNATGAVLSTTNGDAGSSATSVPPDEIAVLEACALRDAWSAAMHQGT